MVIAGSLYLRCNRDSSRRQGFSRIEVPGEPPRPLNGNVALEIGVFGGGSLAMWKEYFGAGAQILGLDINPQCKSHEQDAVEIYIGSQDDPGIIQGILNKYPRIGTALDDGGRLMNHMITSLELLYDNIDARGVYMVEDTHTCCWDEYGGGLRRQGSFIEYAKGKIDEINAVHARGALPISSFTRITDCIVVYDSVVVFEKRPQGSRQAPITGPL